VIVAAKSFHVAKGGAKLAQLADDPPRRNRHVTTPDQTCAVTAFILYLNAIVDEKTELNAATLPSVKMPDRNGT
jgi:hypothetical protein